MKIIGIKQIDELFKSASGPLAQFIELKAGMELAMVMFLFRFIRFVLGKFEKLSESFH